jgi:hypothetical protein
MELDEKPRIDAKTFQEPLWKLAETLAQKVKREGRLPGPPFICEDIHMMIRQAMATYNTLFYINADERREGDCYWNNTYGVVTAPLVRSMIDCLYNITLILENPALHGPTYRKSGMKKRLLDIEEDRATYAGKSEWEFYLNQQTSALGDLIRGSGLTEDEVRNGGRWEPLGRYLLSGTLEDATPHQRFLKMFTHMQWRQYSALSHASFDGYIGEIPSGAYFVLDSLPLEERPSIEKIYVAVLTKHIGRAAMVLLCIVTELQLYFKFEGADINNRICKMWDAIVPFFEVKEIYEERYKPLLEDKGIKPKE